MIRCTSVGLGFCPKVLAEGTVDHTPVYPREVLRRAIELHATGCVLVHNHPSGDATPSRADIDMTKQVAEVCNLLGIAVRWHKPVRVCRSASGSGRERTLHPTRGAALVGKARAHEIEHHHHEARAEYEPTRPDHIEVEIERTLQHP